MSNLSQTQTQENAQEQEHENPMEVFLYALRAPETKRQYPNRLKVLFDFLGLSEPLDNQAHEFLRKGRDNPQWAYKSFVRFIIFQKERASTGQICESTISNYYKAAKLFCEMNDVVLNWKKITKGIPYGRRAANDRAPSMEEIRMISLYPDRRIKPILCLMVSSAIRIGAFDAMKWQHISPIIDDKGQIIAAKLLVYPGDSEQYYTLMTAEAYGTLKSWMDYRASCGEEITGESWVMRDLWRTTETLHGGYFGLARYPKRLKHSGIKSLLERAVKAQGIFKPLPKGVRRREWKVAHGLRKYANTAMIKCHVSPVIKEMLLGHRVGLEDNYFRPNFESDVVPEYLKAVDLLTIDESNRLKKKIEQLTEKTNDSENITKAKLKEKDKEIQNLKDSFKEDIVTMEQKIKEDVKKQLSQLLIRLKPEIVAEGMS